MKSTRRGSFSVHRSEKNARFQRQLDKRPLSPGTSVYLETKLDEVYEDGVKVTGKDGNSFKIDADSVILSVGYNPAPVAPQGKNVHVIGDASKVGNLRTVIWQAWDVAMKL